MITLKEFRHLMMALDRQHGETRNFIYPWDYEPMRSLMNEVISKEFGHLLTPIKPVRPAGPPKPFQYVSKQYTEQFIANTIRKANTAMAGNRSHPGSPARMD